MAIYYLRVRTFGRSQGKSGSRATSAAAYRSGERIRDERTRRVYDHRRRADVMHKEIVLPAQIAAQRDSLAWARNRATLWNAAEHAESRRNSRVAREFVVALPHELVAEKRTQLAMQFAQAIANRYGSAVDVAIHAPRGDARNYHAHLLATTREITPEGLGRKTTLELSGTQRHELGLPRWRQEIGSLRERWADLTNAALESAHLATRVTHLSRAERGLSPSEAPPRVPLAAYHMERRGERSIIAEKIRERHRAEFERARTSPSAHEPQGKSELRAQRLASNVRMVATVGLSLLRDVGVGAMTMWREWKGSFRAESREGSPEPAAKSAAVDVESAESSARLNTLPKLSSERSGRLAQLDERALRSAQQWLASREMQRARKAAGLENTAHESGVVREPDHPAVHEPAHELAAGRHGYDHSL